MVTLVKFVTADHFENTRITFETARMQSYPVKQMRDARKTPLWILEGDPPDDAVHFVPETEQVLSQITSILARDARDECFFSHGVALQPI